MLLHKVTVDASRVFSKQIFKNDHKHTRRYDADQSQRAECGRCPLFIYCPLETGSHSVALAVLKLMIALPLPPRSEMRAVGPPCTPPPPNDKCLNSEEGQFWCFSLWCHLQIHQSLMTGTGAYAEFIMEETQVVEDTVGIHTRIMFSVPETHTSTELFPTSRRCLKATTPA